MQYTHPDIMYAFNRLSSYTDVPSAPVFQGVNNLIQYLDSCPSCHIMYPYGLDGTTTHKPHQKVSPGEFHSQNISNRLVDFTVGGEGHSSNSERAFYCVILFFLMLPYICQTKPNQYLKPINRLRGPQFILGH